MKNTQIMSLTYLRVIVDLPCEERLVARNIKGLMHNGIETDATCIQICLQRGELRSLLVDKTGPMPWQWISTKFKTGTIIYCFGENTLHISMVRK